MFTQFLIENLGFVFFIYGLSFFTMGIAIFLQPRHKSIFKLADIIWLLGAFGVIHGINEWLDMLVIARPSQLYLQSWAQAAALTVSFIFLFEFGAKLFFLNFEKKYFKKWVTPAVFIFVLVLILIFKKQYSVWPRYFLCFPAGILTSAGFILYYYKNKGALRQFKARKYFFTAAAAVGAYSVFSGLIIPRADFFPASVINDASFLKVFGFPVQFLRALCAIALAWACWRVLGVFNQEIICKLQSDLAELTAAKEKLVRSENLAALGRFSSIIGHEFKNELCIMRNAVYFLNLKLQAADVMVKKHLKILEDEISGAERLINNISSFARSRVSNLKPVGLETLLAESVGRLKIPESVEVITNIESGLPLVLVDRVQILRVFENIILNSLQAMAGKGRLVIRANKSEGMVDIAIEDSGCGIKEEEQKMIFEPFFSTKAGGMGLGLAFSKIIIEAHNGAIEIVSRPGKGSSVMINLPTGEEKDA